MTSPAGVPDWMSREARAALGRTSILLAALIAAVALLGWVLHVQGLTEVGLGNNGMKFVTAVSLALLSAALLVRSGPYRAGLCVMVSGLALHTLVEWVTGRSTGFDTLVFSDFTAPGSATPGRMAANTALCLLLLVGALAAVRVGRLRLADWLVVAVLLVTTFALLGFLFGVRSLYSVERFTAMTLPTAIALSLLALAIGLGFEGRVTWVFASTSLGAVMLRRIVAASALVLPVLGWLQLEGRFLGWYGTRFGVALMTYSSMVAVAVVAIVTARRLTITDQRRRAAMAGLRAANDELAARARADSERAEELGQRLAEEQERFRAAVSGLEDLVLTLEVAPDGSLQQVFATTQATTVLGGRPAEVLDVFGVVDERVEPGDRVLWGRFVESVVAGRQAEVECRVTGYDDRVRWIWLRSFPRAGVEPLLVDVIASDVTVRQEMAEQREGMLQEEQRTVQQLRELKQAREEFLAVTGHELKTPLTAIRGFASLLDRDPTLSAAQRTNVEIILRRSQQLGELVSNLFDLAKLDGGLTELSLEAVDLAALLADVVDAHRGIAEESGLGLVATVGPCVMLGDPLRLRQVVDNLLSNAVKYSPGGGTVHVQLATVGGEARLTVADQGIGIPVDEREAVFDRMYRASTARASGVLGTGLGLAVTRSLVEAHGGSISAGENPGGGTVMRVVLPLRQAAEGNPAEVRFGTNSMNSVTWGRSRT